MPPAAAPRAAALRSTLLLATALLGFALLTGGCAIPRDNSTALAAQQAWLGDIRDGVTTAQDITAKLGPPSQTLARGSTLVYRLLAKDDSHRLFASDIVVGLVKKDDPALRNIGVALGAPRTRYFDTAPPEVIRTANPITDRQLNNHSEWDFIAVIDDRGILQRHHMLYTLYVTNYQW